MRIGVTGLVLMAMLVGVTGAEGGSPNPSGSCWYLPPSIYVRDYIPYFALHPPVYYSYPVPRTYGYSPYAYPPGTMTPQVSKPEPVMIHNRFVPSKATDQPKHDRVAQAPLRITNPYVLGEGNPLVQPAPTAAVRRPPPQVVFPMASGGQP